MTVTAPIFTVLVLRQRLKESLYRISRKSDKLILSDGWPD